MKKIITLLLAMSVSSVLYATAVAAEDTSNGFYDIGTSQNVEISVFAGDDEVSAVEKNVDGDEALEQFYEDSNRMEVTYTAATKDEHYGIILVEGNSLPTKDTAIYYINQETAGSANVAFNVYPKLPEDSTDMTLYVSSSDENFSLVSIALSYATDVAGGAPTPSYTPGDINDDGIVDVKDVIFLRRYITGGYNVVVNEGAVDINRDGANDVKDVIFLRRFITGGYGIELH